MQAHPATRHDIADGLKALALLGVFMVNGLGYALALEYPLQLGAPVPIDSGFAQTIHAAVLTIFMGKALPFLAFLYGYSMTLYAKRAADQAALKRRQWKLLLVGVLHGTLVYFGDILTCYALIGLWFGSSVLLRARALVIRWRWLAVLGIAMLWILFKLNGLNTQPLEYRDWALAPEVLTHAASYRVFIEMNTNAYLWQTFSWLWTLAPLHACLFLTGIFAARYRWLSMRPRMPGAAAHRFLNSWYGKVFFNLLCSWRLAMLANALLGLACALMYRQDGLQANVVWITFLNIPIGIWMVASSVLALMRHIQRRQTVPAWLLWLAPAGRHTLAMYLGLSAVLAISGRMGLLTSISVWNHTAVWFAGLLVLWLLAVCMGRAATKHRLRDPIVSWLSR
jgi:uncharacterized protein